MIIDITNHDGCYKKSILLGQPIYELQDNLSRQQADQKNQELAQKVITKFGIDEYLPHPREQYRVDGVMYVDTKLVAEDYFCHALAQGQYDTIYTFCSGAVLPFVQQHKIKIVSLMPDDCPDKLIAGYTLLAQFGIEICPLYTQDL